MKPEKLINLPELARRLGVFYSQVYAVHNSGELIADFEDNKGRPLFRERSLKRAIVSLRKKLTADEFLQLAARIKVSPLEQLSMVDVTGTIHLENQ